MHHHPTTNYRSPSTTDTKLHRLYDPSLQPQVLSPSRDPHAHCEAIVTGSSCTAICNFSSFYWIFLSLPLSLLCLILSGTCGSLFLRCCHKTHHLELQLSLQQLLPALCMQNTRIVPQTVRLTDHHGLSLLTFGCYVSEPELLVFLSFVLSSVHPAAVATSSRFA
jgi:hypothetical protein